MKTVYLDNNATTRTAPEVVEAMLPYFTEKYGNASSMHTFGGSVGKDVETARQSVAALLGAAHADEIIFTGCGTESDNAAIFSAVRSYPEKRHIVTTRVEHPAVLNTCKYLQSQGYGVTYLPVDSEGMISLKELQEAVTPHTAIVSIMMANNETGVVFPVEEAAKIAKARGALFHTDAVQTVGKLPIDLKNSQIDMLSLSGHKLHAPKGIGVLYVKRGTRFIPYIMGGHQEHSRRAGTENVPYIIGLGKACELAGRNIAQENDRVVALRDRLERGLIAAIPNVRVNGGKSPRLPTTLNISFEFIEGEAILLHLSDLGIAASSGSACTSGSLEPSHVLRAMGVPFTFAHGSVRFSLSVYNTEDEIDYVLRELPGVIKTLRAMSPFWHDAQGKACVTGPESL